MSLALVRKSEIFMFNREQRDQFPPASSQSNVPPLLSSSSPTTDANAQFSAMSGPRRGYTDTARQEEPGLLGAMYRGAAITFGLGSVACGVGTAVSFFVAMMRVESLGYAQASLKVPTITGVVLLAAGVAFAILARRAGSAED